MLLSVVTEWVVRLPTQRRKEFRLALRALRAFARDEDGGPLVEFTVLMPIFFLVMFGIIEWGNIFYVQNNMLIAARQAVRQVAVGNASDTGSVAIALACGTSPNPSTPITGSGYTYNFTVYTDANCTGASSPASPSYGNVRMLITTQAAPLTLNYQGLLNGLNLSASAIMQEEFVCPAPGAPAVASSQRC
jgi:Flp pilus assembly protein TadG